MIQSSMTDAAAPIETTCLPLISEAMAFSSLRTALTTLNFRDILLWKFFTTLATVNTDFPRRHLLPDGDS